MPRLARYCAVALILLAPCSLAAADRQAVSCYSLGLQNPPPWITSGATWDKNRQRFVVVDPVNDQVISYNILSGERQTLTQLEKDRQPVKIGQFQDGFLVEFADGSMLHLDRRFAVIGRPEAKVSPPVNSSLYQWASDGAGGLVAFAAVGFEDTRYGFFRVQQGSSRLQPLLDADKKDELQPRFFLMGSPWIANSDGETFFLSMAKRNALYRVRDGKAERLRNGLPREYATRPDLKTPLRGRQDAPARYAELETLSIPAGLYAQDGYLYLLTRKPAGEGQTAWTLHQIDPAGDGSVLGSVRLPTAAHHLTVIPTPDRGWLFIERGEVVLDSSGKQRNKTVGPVVVVSNDAIRFRALLTSCPTGGGILWADEEHSVPLFIPRSLLASRLVLPVGFSSQDHLDLRLSGKPRGASTCDFLEPSSGQGSLEEPSSLEDLVNSSPVAVVGRIVSTEPGWDTRLRHVVTKVEVKVTDTIKGAFLPGSRIEFLSPGGSMSLAGKSICTTPREGFYRPEAGDQIVVSAELSAAEPLAGDPRLLEAPYVFPLREELVLPEPYPALRIEQKPVALDKLLAAEEIVSSSSGTF
jgi:hypothetical protein